MNRWVAYIMAVCLLVTACLAPASLTYNDTPEPQSPGTRAVFPGLVVDSNITEDTTWDTSWPYIFVKGEVRIFSGITLTILPGVQVKFDLGASLVANGTIKANGLVNLPIYFIPYSDNPGTLDWKGIYLQNNTQASQFNHVYLRYAEGGIACWGTNPSIQNTSIEYTFYYGILCGENSEPVIKRCYVNFTEWGGIICENRSHAFIQDTEVRTCYYGIICYDIAEIHENYISLCWLGIVCWGDANVTRNEIRDCMDGIHGFYSAPRIEENDIVSCDGNGTRFINSDAIIRNNTFRYNNVGMDIGYEAKNLLLNMEGNRVNGIDINTCFYVGQNDIVIEDLFADSGWSDGFYGTLTAQGSVTLYDCHNVTFRDCTILNSVNSIYAANSSFKIYESTFDNARNAQIYLYENASGVAFNRSVDPESVRIGGQNCLFQTYDNLQVQVLDYYGEPIEGANVMVRESQLLLHNTTTNSSGLTPVLLVKDRTATEAGTIGSALNIQVISEGYNFDPNPRTGIYVNLTNFVSFSDLGDIFPPNILAVSVTEGDKLFPINGNITITFDEPMNQESVEEAFSISGNVTGTFTWNGFNLTFTPDNLQYKTAYTVLITTDAMDLWNNSLEDPYSLSFTTVDEPGTSSNTLMIAVIAIFAIAGIAGFLVLRKLK